VAGVRVTAETAQTISALWACTTLLSETIGWLPLGIFQFVDDDTKNRARNHPLYDVVHTQPNKWQTAMEFRSMMTGHVILRGNAYAQIVPGARGPVDQLIPIHPDRIPPGNVERLPDGSLRYMVKQKDGSTKPVNGEDIFHLRGPSDDGIVGKSIIDYGRDSFGLTLAAERYGGRFFRNDSRPGGVLRMDGSLKEGAAQRLKSSWEAAHSGSDQHRVAVLEDGLQWQQVGLTNEDAQFLETREFQAEDVCRWFRVPPWMIGLTSKTTSWGSGIEAMGIGFVTYTLMPWLTRWSQTISKDLIIAPDRFFAEFIVEGLLRGDIKSRYGAYATARQWGWLSVNDIRRLENMNAIGEGGDQYLRPLNMVDVGDDDGAIGMGGASTGSAGGGAGGNDSTGAAHLASTGSAGVAGVAGDSAGAAHLASTGSAGVAGGHYYLLAQEAAGRVVRKEIAAMNRAAKNTYVSQDIEAWEVAVNDFYKSHSTLVSETMRMPMDKVNIYIGAGQGELIEFGPGTMVDWQARRVDDLVRLAVGFE
jgi:HK97 family phage portal protein